MAMTANVETLPGVGPAMGDESRESTFDSFRSIPCPGRLNAVRMDGVDEWTVWQRTVTESRT